MFARSRFGRRATPARLNVEQLEDRFVPSGDPLGAGFSAPALAGSVAPPRTYGSWHDQSGPHFEMSADKHTGPAEDHGPAALQDRGPDEEPADHAGGWWGVSTSEPSSVAHGKPSTEYQGDKSSSDEGTVLAWGQANSTAAGKGRKTTDDSSDSEASSSGHASSSADHPSGFVLGGEPSGTAAQAAPADTAESITLAAVRPPTPSLTINDQPSDVGRADEPTGPPEGDRPMGPLPSSAAPAGGDGTTETSARPSAAVASVAGPPMLILNRLAPSADGAEGGATGAAPAAAAAAGTSTALAVLDLRSAGAAALHGTTDPDNDLLEVPRTGGTTLVRGGTPAEAADLGAPGAPVAPSAAYVGYAARQAPADGLLGRLALDTRALDEALQGFMHGLDRLGERLADPRSRLGISAWLLTGAAALAVVEVDRRRRAAAAEGAADVPLTWPGPGGPASEPTA